MIHLLKVAVDRDTPSDAALPLVSIAVNGRRLSVETNVVDETNKLADFTLAELVLSEDGTNLTLQMNAHPRVAIDPVCISLSAILYKLK